MSVEKEENKPRNKMYNVEENAVAKIGVRKEGKMENEFKKKENKDILVISVPDLFTEIRRPQKLTSA